jgi:TrpR-related protein YerC/YecD
MAKFESKLSKSEVGKLFYKLCLAISEIKKPEEAASLLGDLLSLQEAEMIAKRLKIAELLLDGDSYNDIKEKIKVSYGTIARVQEWLKISGEGYRQAVKRTKNKNIEIKNECPTIDLNVIKKRYPMYYWPEIVLENIIKTASKRQKNKLKSIIESMKKMKEKTDLYKKLNKIIK